MKQTLKNFLAGICLVAASVAATTSALAADINGRVRGVNVRASTLVVDEGRRNVTVTVTNRTRIELDRRNDRRGPGYGNPHNRGNQRLRLSDIRSGNFVHIRGINRGRQFIADEIEVRR